MARCVRIEVRWVSLRGREEGWHAPNPIKYNRKNRICDNRETIAPIVAHTTYSFAFAGLFRATKHKTRRLYNTNWKHTKTTTTKKHAIATNYNHKNQNNNHNAAATSARLEMAEVSIFAFAVLAQCSPRWVWRTTMPLE